MLRWILNIVAVDSTFLDALRFTGDDLFSMVRPFGKRFIQYWRLALGKPFSPFLPFMSHFVYCYNNSLLLTYNCLLLPPVDVLILMDPNGSPLQVFNPVMTHEETPTVHAWNYV